MARRNHWFLVLGILLISVPSAFGVWADQLLDSSIESIVQMQAIDLDGDGDIDLVASPQDSSQTLSWFENDGSAAFAEQPLMPDVTGIERFVASDIDLDGDEDLVLVRAGTVVVMENEGDFDYASHVLPWAPLSVRGIDVGDLDGDGDLDIAAIDFGNYQEHIGEVVWFEQQANLSFVQHTLAGNARFYQLNVADGDDDGDPDLLVSAAGDYLIFDNDGEGQFTEDVLMHYANAFQYILVPADMDSDGDLDMVSGNGPIVGGSSVNWLERTDDGTFEHRIIPWISISIAEFQVVDLNNDGLMDVVPGSSGYSFIYQNTGDGAFEVDYMGGYNYYCSALAVADFDGDGEMNLVKAYTNGILEYWDQQDDVPPVADPYPLVNSVSNFGSYSDPHHNLPSGEFPFQSEVYNFWSNNLWIGARVDGESLVSHSDYGAWEFKPSGDPRPEEEHVVLGGPGNLTSYTTQFDDLEETIDHTPIGLQIDQTVTVPDPDAGPRGAHLVEITVTNVSGEALDSVYVGCYFDCDIGANISAEPHMDDRVGYDPERELAYMWDGDLERFGQAAGGVEYNIDDTGEFGAVPAYAGIRILDGPTETAAFQWWNWDENPYSDHEKYMFLAGTHPAADGPYRTPPETVFDYRVMVSCGPFTLAAGASENVVMTYAVGDGLEDLEQQVDEMLAYYQTGVQEAGPATRPREFSLLAPYPNPFNAGTIVPLTLPVRETVDLTVVDVLGRQVMTLHRGMLSAGHHEFTLPGNDLASGLYFVRLKGESGPLQARKVMLIK